MIWDAFILNDELDLLECRLVELNEVVDRFVIVEAAVTFTNQPKPSHYLGSRERFSAWEDQIVHVWATDLPSGPDPWTREHAQRNHIGRALKDADPADIVMLSDVDEIPNPTVVGELQPGNGYLALVQRYYSFAVDWQMPLPWYGTVAAHVGTVGDGWASMRDCRNTAPRVPDGGWHLSWLGGADECVRKAEAFSHTEIVDEVRAGLEDDIYLRDGATLSVFNGATMIPVDVDDSWPRWIAEGRCPSNWFRPRESDAS